jgi:hypothetical protein
VHRTNEASGCMPVLALFTMHADGHDMHTMLGDTLQVSTSCEALPPGRRRKSLIYKGTGSDKDRKRSGPLSGTSIPRPAQPSAAGLFHA